MDAATAFREAAKAAGAADGAADGAEFAPADESKRDLTISVLIGGRWQRVVKGTFRLIEVVPVGAPNNDGNARVVATWAVEAFDGGPDRTTDPASGVVVERRVWAMLPAIQALAWEVPLAPGVPVTTAFEPDREGAPT